MLRDGADKHKRYMAVDPTVKFAENLVVVQSEVTRYLQDSPCGSQIPEQIHEFLTRLAQWRLTKQEKLQILNLRAKSLVDLHLVRFVHISCLFDSKMQPSWRYLAIDIDRDAPLHPLYLNQIIEECEERFIPEELEQLLEIVQTTLPRDDEPEISEQGGNTDDKAADEV
ncbi:hypothetical protein BC937DRAFT_86790 [Endogone sp. FLAS-F59071]|nr:hypothetical protein BC937DRAFT_86790 [Endogone sp. FLAS-F59071]|eukprot:RUS19867.1 hypothetical protein BC937DRAFT_86790 [Endogone sp. FLAS-F59071]